MNRPAAHSCGYQGHMCLTDQVSFISRYRDETDYCVGGHRVTLYDDSTVKAATADQIAALELKLIADYAWYLLWHCVQRARYGADWPTIQPFGAVFPLTVRL